MTLSVYSNNFLTAATASAGMVLLNKAALSSFNFNAPMSLLFFQCIVCVILVRLSAFLGFIKVEPWNPAIIKLWFPVNLIFVGMIFTSFFALKNLGVPMATVLKNLTNLFTIGGDYLLYKKVGVSYSQLRAVQAYFLYFVDLTWEPCACF